MVEFDCQQYEILLWGEREHQSSGVCVVLIGGASAVVALFFCSESCWLCVQVITNHFGNIG